MQIFARSVVKQQRWDEAIAVYQQLLTTYPHAQHVAYCGWGQVLVQQGKLAEAITIYNKVIAFRPQDSEAHYLLGMALQQQQKLPAAKAAFQKALQFDPQHQAARQSLKQIDRQ
ncbi:tetratricopeptide repeat protein [Chamaesiphon polymorphus]|nr:tetratricopeptide repeat protein [Chamaesiphon polymorphus]